MRPSPATRTSAIPPFYHPAQASHHRATAPTPHHRTATTALPPVYYVLGTISGERPLWLATLGYSMSSLMGFLNMCVYVATPTVWKVRCVILGHTCRENHLGSVRTRALVPAPQTPPTPPRTPGFRWRIDRRGCRRRNRARSGTSSRSSFSGDSAPPPPRARGGTRRHTGPSTWTQGAVGAAKEGAAVNGVWRRRAAARMRCCWVVATTTRKTRASLLTRSSAGKS